MLPSVKQSLLPSAQIIIAGARAGEAHASVTVITAVNGHDRCVEDMAQFEEVLLSVMPQRGKDTDT